MADGHDVVVRSLATLEPLLVLRWARGKIAESCALPLTPGWAKPILAAAMKISSA